MHVVNSMVANFGKINLDTSALGMRSVSKTDIKLPYSGVLPEQMAVPSSAYVYFNVQLVQGVRLVLVVKSSGKDIKCPLEATNEEIVTLLDKFFDQSQSETGMAPYWLLACGKHITSSGGKSAPNQIVCWKSSLLCLCRIWSS